MSRNLLRTDCWRCHGEVTLSGPSHPITHEECGVLIDEYDGMIVADAACSVCAARYLAWVDERQRKRPLPVWLMRRGGDGSAFFDLSFRSTFNDEPGEEDLPPWEPPPKWTKEHVGRMFWNHSAQRAEHLVDIDAYGRYYFTGNDAIVGYPQSTAEHVFALVPLGWCVNDGRLMRPVTSEEIPA